MNQGLDCGTTVPYAYSKAEENTWVSSEDDKPHASVDTLYVQDDWTNGGRTQHPETLTLVKFKIPPLPANMDASLFKYRIRLLAAKRKRTAPIKFSFTRPAVTGTSVPCPGTINRRSTTVPMPCYIWTIHMSIAWLMSIKRCAKRWRKENGNILVYRRRPSGNHYDFTPADSKQSLVLMLTGFKKTPEL